MLLREKKQTLPVYYQTFNYFFFGVSSVTVRTGLIKFEMRWLFIPAAGSPPISYECVFLWIGVTLCFVKVMDKTQPPIFVTILNATSDGSFSNLKDIRV